MSKKTGNGPYKGGITHSGSQIIQGARNSRGPGSKPKTIKGTDLRSGKK